MRLYDRGRLIRRFLVNGVKEFKKNLDEYHNQQRSFVLVAVDVEGGKAISWSRRTEVQENWFFMCGDNMNDMGPGGKASELDRGLLNLSGTECIAEPLGAGSTWSGPNLAARFADGRTTVDNLGWRAGMKDCSLVSRFGMVVNYPLGYYWDGPGVVGTVSAAPLMVNPFFGGNYRCYSFVRRPPGPELEIRQYTITVKQDAELTGTPGVCLMPGSNWKLREGQLNHVVYFSPEHVPVVESPTRESGAQSYNLTVKPGEYVGIYPMCTAIFPLDDVLYAAVNRNPVEPRFTLLQVGVGQVGEKLAKGTTIRKRFAVLRLPFASEGEYTWLPEYKRYWNSNLLMEDVRQKMGLAGPPAYSVTPKVGSVLDTKLALRLKADTFGFRGRIAKCHLPIGLPVFVEGLNPRWSAGVWYKGVNTLLQTEYPPGYCLWTKARLHYVPERTEDR